MEIEGKVAVVTGAGKRVGRAIALALAERGAELVVHYHQSEHEAHEVLAHAKRLGGKPIAVQADLAEPADIARLVDTATRAFSRIEILVNSAAVFFRVPFLSLTESDWDHVMAVNLKAPFLLCRSIGEVMLRQGMGKIVNIADIAASQVWVDYLPYSISKAGLVALTKGAAKALAPAVQVNAVCPGTVLLPEDFPAEEREPSVRRVPLKRLGTPEDVVRAVLYLIDSDFVTGDVLTVDGGQRLQRA